MDKATFDDYIARFNRQDDTAFDDYIAEDMHMKNGLLEFTGVDGMKEHYQLIWRDFDEELFPTDFVSSDTNVAIRMFTRFTAIHDADDALFGSVKKGDRFEFRGVISYQLNAEGKFADVLVAYNSFTSIPIDGPPVELGIPH
jgi:hypothetical protein